MLYYCEQLSSLCNRTQCVQKHPATSMAGIYKCQPITRTNCHLSNTTNATLLTKKCVKSTNKSRNFLRPRNGWMFQLQQNYEQWLLKRRSETLNQNFAFLCSVAIVQCNNCVVFQMTEIVKFYIKNNLNSNFHVFHFKHL